jgi:endonuclease/exonuclease/phosphatase family metal-dependent hydrolase
MGRRIDYILIRCGIRGPSLAIASCRTIFDDAVDGVWASDHFGVLAELRTINSQPALRRSTGSEKSTGA